MALSLHKALSAVLFAFFSLSEVAEGALLSRQSSSPSVTIKNGSYHGLHNPTYNQDFFLGMPFAQPPVGDLRLRNPVPLNTTWTNSKNATQYGHACYGYGSDDWVLGNPVSEDCLTINVIRPGGSKADAKLPIGV